MSKVHISILYGLIVVLFLVCAYLLFQQLNAAASVKTITRFLDGDVFSNKFHNVMGNYFAHSENLDLLVNQLLPLVYAHTVPMMTTAPVQETTKTIVRDMAEGTITTGPEDEEEEEEEEPEEPPAEEEEPKDGPNLESIPVIETSDILLP